MFQKYRERGTRTGPFARIPQCWVLSPKPTSYCSSLRQFSLSRTLSTHTPHFSVFPPHPISRTFSPHLCNSPPGAQTHPTHTHTPLRNDMLPPPSSPTNSSVSSSDLDTEVWLLALLVWDEDGLGWRVQVLKGQVGISAFESSSCRISTRFGYCSRTLQFMA
nr:uncharacterized protein LOC103427443 [Malus domestica]